MTTHPVKTINVHELKKRRDASPNLCLIDVREEVEWQEQHIPQALHIPKDTLSANIAAVAPQHDCPIYLHCRGGTRSMYAAQCLVEMGYQDVYSIDGGITEWAKAGYPVES